MLHYNYLIFNSIDENRIKANPNGYYTICMKDLDSINGIKVISYPLDYSKRLIRIIFRIFNSRYIIEPLKSYFAKMWFPFYFNHKFENCKPLCFIFLNPYIPSEYYNYIKQNYSNSRIVAIHRDLIKIWSKQTPYFINNPRFDLEMSIDYQEAKDNNMVYFEEFESKIEMDKDKNYPLCDVFFAGKAKDRLDKLIKIYDFLEQHNVNPYFYITGVKPCNRILRKGIVYADKQMKYTDMLYYSVNSKCILELNQKDAVGFTSRFLEAVMYNKKLITDNYMIGKHKFYNPQYIQLINEAEDIDINFIVNDVDNVDYNYNNEFSPIHLIQQIDDELISRYGITID